MSHAVHCPLCGLEQATDNIALDDPLAEAERVQALIDRLIEQRAALLRRVNDQKSLPGKLPPEIISIIFRLACQPPDSFNSSKIARNSPPSPSILGAVSAYWREIVSNLTPSLPMFPTVCVEVNNSNVFKVVSLLRRCFRKYGHQGLTVELDFAAQMAVNEAARKRRQEIEDEHSRDSDYEEEYHSLGDETDQEVPLLPVRDVIFEEYPECVKALLWINPPHMWLDSTNSSKLCITWSKLIRLKSLHFIWKGHPHANSEWSLYEDLEAAPKLQELILRGVAKMTSYYHNSPFILYGNNITNLQLFKIPYDTCLQLLILCDNLQSCSMMRPISSIYNFKLTYNESKTKLETLEWTFNRDYQVLWLLSVGFPALHTLVLHNIWECQRGETHTWGLEIFSQLPISCKSLVIGMDSHYSNEISHTVPVTILQKLAEALEHIHDTVAQICLRSPCIGFASVINVDEEQGCPQSLNKISKISILNDHRDYNNKISGGRCSCCQGSNTFKSSAFLKAMRARLAALGAGSSFCFEYDADCMKIDWDAGDQEKLKELEDQGFNLYIFEDGKLVNWL